ncbi:MAG: PTS sugar transporter subunit IIA [Lachnospiraceae bacterium]
MLFGKKKETKKPDLLVKENILLNCKSSEKKQVILQMGSLLVNGGYVSESYPDAMLEREKTFSTYMGNGIAIPHGVDSAKDEVIYSGLGVMIFPEGTDWDGEQAKIVIGIAGKGEEHLEILGNVALKLGEEEAVEALLSMNVDEIYEFLTRKDDVE